MPDGVPTVVDRAPQCDHGGARNCEHMSHAKRHLAQEWIPCGAANSAAQSSVRTAARFVVLWRCSTNSGSSAARPSQTLSQVQWIRSFFLFFVRVPSRAVDMLVILVTRTVSLIVSRCGSETLTD